MEHMQKRSERIIEFCEKYLFVPEGALVGEKIKLAEFQKKFIREVYDNPNGTRRAYLSIARKNAKSATIACLLLAHIIGPERKQNSQIVSGARSRDQAALVYELAAKMLNMQPKFQGLYRLVPSSKRIIGLKANVEYRALSAEAKTAHGLSPVVAILDEVGQVTGPRDDFIDAITTSQGAHKQPLLLAISTQAADDADLFSVWLDDAANSKDPKIVSHVYAAPKDAGLLDEEGWRAANPALGLFRSFDDLQEQAKQAVRMPSSENMFRNLCLNQRVSTVSPFISRDVWQSCGEAPKDMEGLELYGGLDLSARTDLTAFTAVGRDDSGRWHVFARFWAPEDGLIERSKVDRVPYDVWAKAGFLTVTPGKTVDYSFVAQDLADFLSQSTVKMIAYDRWRMDLLQKELEIIGVDLPLEPFGQGFKDMSPALDVLESELLNGRIAHGMHPVLTMCAANAVITKDSAGNRKLDKHKATGRIDGMVALAMALGVASRLSEDEGIILDDFLADPVRVY